MQKAYFFILIFLVSFISCKKDNDNLISGTVKVKAGCLSDSWLVAIDNPNLAKHSFLCADSVAVVLATYYNCNNSVYISLPSSLAVEGTRIRFSYIQTDPSCLSYSAAPPHIQVNKLSRR
jgi:hypothetical protein